MREFLLHGPAQQHGSHAGAVAGTIVGSAAVQYVYGEITGYYLHWLASLGPADAAVLPRMRAATAWLDAYLDSEALPLTRIYLDAAPDDWRNQALFAFDLAMIAGGLARARAAGLDELPPALVPSLLAWLRRFVAGGDLRVCLLRKPGVELPGRWSTLGGSFTAKTASRILLLDREGFELPAELREACADRLAVIARLAERNGLDMIHPTLYALEGCLLDPDADPERLALWLEQVLALQGPDGTLPESLQTPQVRRSDIIAQALRVAIFLRRRLDQPGRWEDACERLASALVARQRADGSLGFDASRDEANTWCTMFAEQALRLRAADLAQAPLPFGAEDLA